MYSSVLEHTCVRTLSLQTVSLSLFHLLAGVSRETRRWCKELRHTSENANSRLYPETLEKSTYACAAINTFISKQFVSKGKLGLLFVLACTFRINLWWFDPGWIPGAHWGRYHFPSSARLGREKYNSKLVGKDKGRKRSLTN